jgi:AdoMet-dependent rRNA methyltransferase SPB1
MQVIYFMRVYVGSSYSKDAYVQNELVLAALKTATLLLKAGGTFCTKIYRSTDYNALIWVLQQLFEDVQSVKPSSSRSQSSEIFLVCMKYTAPSYIDAKLLDPSYVFKEVESESKTVDVLHKKFESHNKRHRSGYGDGQGILLSKETPLYDFIHSKEPIRVISDYDKISLTTIHESLKALEIPDDIQEIMSDLKIRNKADYKKLLKWRKSVLEEFSQQKVTDKIISSSKKKVVEKDSLDHELSEMNFDLLLKQKKAMKKVRKVAAKERGRLELGISNNVFEESSLGEMFDLDNAKVLEESYGENFVDIVSFSTSESEDEMSDSVDVDENQSITGSDELDDSLVGNWYSRPTFNVVFSGEMDIKEVDDTGMTSIMPLTEKVKRSLKRKKESDKRIRKLQKSQVDIQDGGFGSSLNDHADASYNRHKDLISLGLGKLSNATESGFEIVKTENSNTVMEDLDDHDKFVNLALGSVMLNPKKRKEIVDASYNRYSWENDDDLPGWFLEDETRHNKPEIPVPSTLLNQVNYIFWQMCFII